jgi:hypothetical protein
MGGLFDLLGGRGDDDDEDQADRSQSDGLAAVDMVSLPLPQLRIMRLMLKQREMTYPQLCEAVGAMPEAERLSQTELDEALSVLLEQRWLIRVDDNQPDIYKVNLRRKSAGRLDSFVPRRSRRMDQPLPGSLWDALDPDSGPDQNKPSAQDGGHS